MQGKHQAQRQRIFPAQPSQLDRDNERTLRKVRWTLCSSCGAPNAHQMTKCGVCGKSISHKIDHQPDITPLEVKNPPETTKQENEEKGNADYQNPERLSVLSENDPSNIVRVKTSTTMRDVADRASQTLVNGLQPNQQPLKTGPQPSEFDPPTENFLILPGGSQEIRLSDVSSLSVGMGTDDRDAFSCYIPGDHRRGAVALCKLVTKRVKKQRFNLWKRKCLVIGEAQLTWQCLDVIRRVEVLYRLHHILDRHQWHLRAKSFSHLRSFVGFRQEAERTSLLRAQTIFTRLIHSKLRDAFTRLARPQLFVARRVQRLCSCIAVLQNHERRSLGWAFSTWHHFALRAQRCESLAKTFNWSLRSWERKRLLEVFQRLKNACRWTTIVCKVESKYLLRQKRTVFKQVKMHALSVRRIEVMVRCFHRQQQSLALQHLKSHVHKGRLLSRTMFKSIGVQKRAAFEQLKRFYERRKSQYRSVSCLNRFCRRQKIQLAFRTWSEDVKKLNNAQRFSQRRALKRIVQGWRRAALNSLSIKAFKNKQSIKVMRFCFQIWETMSTRAIERIKTRAFLAWRFATRIRKESKIIILNRLSYFWKVEQLGQAWRVLKNYTMLSKQHEHDVCFTPLQTWRKNVRLCKIAALLRLRKCWNFWKAHKLQCNLPRVLKKVIGRCIIRQAWRKLAFHGWDTRKTATIFTLWRLAQFYQHRIRSALHHWHRACTTQASQQARFKQHLNNLADLYTSRMTRQAFATWRIRNRLLYLTSAGIKHISAVLRRSQMVFCQRALFRWKMFCTNFARRLDKLTCHLDRYDRLKCLNFGWIRWQEYSISREQQKSFLSKIYGGYDVLLRMRMRIIWVKWNVLVKRCSSIKSFVSMRQRKYLSMCLQKWRQISSRQCALRAILIGFNYRTQHLCVAGAWHKWQQHCISSLFQKQAYRHLSLQRAFDAWKVIKSDSDSIRVRKAFSFWFQFCVTSKKDCLCRTWSAWRRLSLKSKLENRANRKLELQFRRHRIQVFRLILRGLYQRHIRAGISKAFRRWSQFAEQRSQQLLAAFNLNRISQRHGLQNGFAQWKLVACIHSIKAWYYEQELEACAQELLAKYFQRWYSVVRVRYAKHKTLLGEEMAWIQTTSRLERMRFFFREWQTKLLHRNQLRKALVRWSMREKKSVLRRWRSFTDRKAQIERFAKLVGLRCKSYTIRRFFSLWRRRSEHVSRLQRARRYNKNMSIAKNMLWQSRIHVGLQVCHHLEQGRANVQLKRGWRALVRNTRTKTVLSHTLWNWRLMNLRCGFASWTSFLRKQKRLQRVVRAWRSRQLLSSFHHWSSVVLCSNQERLVRMRAALQHWARSTQRFIQTEAFRQKWKRHENTTLKRFSLHRWAYNSRVSRRERHLLRISCKQKSHAVLYRLFHRWARAVSTRRVRILTKLRSRLFFNRRQHLQTGFSKWSVNVHISLRNELKVTSSHTRIKQTAFVQWHRWSCEQRQSRIALLNYNFQGWLRVSSQQRAQKLGRLHIQLLKLRFRRLRESFLKLDCARVEQRNFDRAVRILKTLRKRICFRAWETWLTQQKCARSVLSVFATRQWLVSTQHGAFSRWAQYTKSLATLERAVKAFRVYSVHKAFNSWIVFAKKQHSTRALVRYWQKMIRKDAILQWQAYICQQKRLGLVCIRWKNRQLKLAFETFTQQVQYRKLGRTVLDSAFRVICRHRQQCCIKAFSHWHFISYRLRQEKHTLERAKRALKRWCVQRQQMAFEHWFRVISSRKESIELIFKCCWGIYKRKYQTRAFLRWKASIEVSKQHAKILNYMNAFMVRWERKRKFNSYRSSFDIWVTHIQLLNKKKTAARQMNKIYLRWHSYCNRDAVQQAYSKWRCASWAAEKRSAQLRRTKRVLSHWHELWKNNTYRRCFETWKTIVLKERQAYQQMRRALRIMASWKSMCRQQMLQTAFGMWKTHLTGLRDHEVRMKRLLANITRWQNTRKAKLCLWALETWKAAVAKINTQGIKMQRITEVLSNWHTMCIQHSCRLAFGVWKRLYELENVKRRQLARVDDILLRWRKKSMVSSLTIWKLWIVHEKYRHSCLKKAKLIFKHWWSSRLDYACRRMFEFWKVHAESAKLKQLQSEKMLRFLNRISNQCTATARQKAFRSWQEFTMEYRARDIAFDKAKRVFSRYFELRLCIASRVAFSRWHRFMMNSRLQTLEQRQLKGFLQRWMAARERNGIRSFFSRWQHHTDLARVRLMALARAKSCFIQLWPRSKLHSSFILWKKWSKAFASLHSMSASFKRYFLRQTLRRWSIAYVQDLTISGMAYNLQLETLVRRRCKLQALVNQRVRVELRYAFVILKNSMGRVKHLKKALLSSRLRLCRLAWNSWKDIIWKRKLTAVHLYKLQNSLQSWQHRNIRAAFQGWHSKTQRQATIEKFVLRAAGNITTRNSKQCLVAFSRWRWYCLQQTHQRHLLTRTLWRWRTLCLRSAFVLWRHATTQPILQSEALRRIIRCWYLRRLRHAWARLILRTKLKTRKLQLLKSVCSRWLCLNQRRALQLLKTHMQQQRVKAIRKKVFLLLLQGRSRVLLRAAFQKWRHSIYRAHALLQTCSHWRTRALRSAVRKWKTFDVHQRFLQLRMQHMFKTLQHWQLVPCRFAFERWKEHSLLDRRVRSKLLRWIHNYKFMNISVGFSRWKEHLLYSRLNTKTKMLQHQHLYWTIWHYISRKRDDALRCSWKIWRSYVTHINSCRRKEMVMRSRILSSWRFGQLSSTFQAWKSKVRNHTVLEIVVQKVICSNLHNYFSFWRKITLHRRAQRCIMENVFRVWRYQQRRVLSRAFTHWYLMGLTKHNHPSKQLAKQLSGVAESTRSILLQFISARERRQDLRRSMLWTGWSKICLNSLNVRLGNECRRATIERSILISFARSLMVKVQKFRGRCVLRMGWTRLIANVQTNQLRQKFLDRSYLTWVSARKWRCMLSTFTTWRVFSLRMARARHILQTMQRVEDAWESARKHRAFAQWRLEVKLQYMDESQARRSHAAQGLRDVQSKARDTLMQLRLARSSSRLSYLS